MSLVLAIDTATPAVTAGIVDGGGVLAERVSIDARAHAERITPNVLAALADAGRAMADLGAVVVGLRSRPVHRSAGRHGDRGGLRTRTGHPGVRGLQPRCHRRADHRRGAGGDRRPSARGLLGPLSRRCPHRRAGGQRAGRRRPGSRAVGRRLARPRRAVRAAVHRAAVPDRGGSGGRGRRLVAAAAGAWCRCICVGRMPRPSPSGRHEQ